MGIGALVAPDQSRSDHFVVFIEQDGTAAGDELGAVRQAYQYLLKV